MPVFVVLLILWQTQAYILFHTVVEMTSIFIALAVYLVGTRTSRYAKNDAFLFLSIAFFYVMILDILHTLSYKGMNMIGWATANSATQFWIAGRMMQVFSIIITPVFFQRKVHRKLLHLVFMVTTGLVFISIRYGFFPDCYIEGEGLTLFKILMEYVMVLLAVLAILLQDKLNTVSGSDMRRLIKASLGFLVLSELSFTLYVDLYGTMNAIGHLLKIVAYWMLWEMVFRIGFVNPYELLSTQISYNSTRDQLTGVFNRGYFESQIQKLDMKEQYPLAIVHADINGLKVVNEGYGYAAADEILKDFVRLLQEYRPRSSGEHFTARIGGDSFVVVLGKTSHKQVSDYIDILKQTLARRSEGVVFSASFGTAIKTHAGQDLKHVITAAEDDLYAKKLEESPSARKRTIDLLLHALFNKSQREHQHSERVASISEAIATELGFSKERIMEIRTAGILHDIGKIAISDSILNKDASLSDSEWVEIKRHPEISFNLLNSVQAYSPVARFALHHHERWDGKGYPHGVSGNEIPLQARIITIADAFDAMVSERSYKKGLSLQEAVNEIIANAGKQFDPLLARLFIEKVLKEHWEPIDATV
jgi:diguanylate cyclase (GGDEF)-like protein/putative nucleotidyltransferase with HDIG domain